MTAWLRWLLGLCAFFLPVLIAVIGKQLDHSAYRHHPTYKALIPFAVFGALALAAAVPAILLFTSRLRLPYKIGLTAAAWCLLALQLYWVFLAIVVTP